ncbi:hypothetical protein SDC9_132324 [bioreactor metagenome]|uniref:Uncharacterized protein n=1 Tax=bioreactor metagenome TaxID=1076179 RepID=A0A645D7A8_9ZZZZ
MDGFEGGVFYHCFCQGDLLAGHIGDGLGHAVYLREGNVHHTTHIADGHTRAQGTKGDDLGHFICAVVPGTIFHDHAAFVVLEVEVDIWHGDTARVQETLKDQAVFDWLDHGDIQGVGHHGTGRRATGVVPHVVGGGKTGEIPHNEEVGVKAHLMNDRKLIFQTLTYFGVIGLSAIFADEAFFAKLAQVGLSSKAIWHRELGQVIALAGDIHIAALGDHKGVLERFRVFREEGGHFFGRAQIERITRHTHAVGVADKRAGLNAQHDVL